MPPSVARRLAPVFLCALAAADCEAVGGGECGGEATVSVFEGYTAAALYSGPAFTSSLASGRRKFNWSGVVEDICSSEKATPSWQILVHKNQLPPGWQVRAGYATTPVTGAEVTLRPSDSGVFGQGGTYDRQYFGSAEVGMEQGSVLGRAQIAMDIEFSFVSQGDLSIDRELAQRVDPNVSMRLTYKVPKQTASAITAP